MAPIAAGGWAVLADLLWDHVMAGQEASNYDLRGVLSHGGCLTGGVGLGAQPKDQGLDCLGYLARQRPEPLEPQLKR